MKVEIQKSFAIPSSAATAWLLLQDVEKVAGCMPGAKITERIGEQQYKGTVAVKFGPASMNFRGEVQVTALDAESRTLRLAGKGTDSTGSSGAAMDLTARIEAVDDTSCNLVGTSEVAMSGKAAAFGGRMMNSVADQVLKQFAANFATQAQALQAQAPTEAPGAPAADAPADEGPAAAPAAAIAAPAPVAAAPAPLNGLALMCAVFRDWLRSLFAPRKA